MNGRENDTESNSDTGGSSEPSPQWPSENSISPGATGGTVTGAASGRISNDSTAMASADRHGVAKNWYEKESLLKFVTPCTIGLFGMSNCGKSTYIKKMLEHADGVFTEPPKRVVFCYNIFQELFHRMAETVPNISFHEGVPDRATMEEWSAQIGGGHLMIVFDDLYNEVIQSKAVCDLSILLSHHLNISSIISSHNIFMGAKYSKTITTNLHYIGLFTIRNRRHLSILGSQLFAHKNNARNFVKVYDLVRNQNSLGNPLIIDNSPRSNTNRNHILRSRVLPGENPIIYEIS